MSDGFFDERVAAFHDTASADRFADDVLGPTLERLIELADGGRVLEFAIGTGRVGLALHHRGVDVTGLELSNAMVERLRAKPGGADVPVVIGDMAETRVPGDFDLVVLVYSTITNLLTQDGQVACFLNAAAHLRPGGRFVIEVGVPRLRRLPMGERFVVYDVSEGHTGIDEYDVAGQLLVSHHTWVRGGRAETLDSTHRFAWPAEYDLMARLAGLSLTDRWSDWHRSPFTSESTQHISVWTKAAPPVS